MTVSRAQSAPARALDYDGVRQSSTVATSHRPVAEPYGNAAAQRPPAGTDPQRRTPVLDAVAGLHATSDVSTHYTDPLAELPDPRVQLDRSVGVGSPGAGRVSGSLDATRGLNDQGIGERYEGGATVGLYGNQVDAGVRWDDLHQRDAQIVGTSNSIGGRVGGGGFGVTAGHSETTSTAGGGSRTVGGGMALTSDGTFSGSISATSRDAEGKAGNAVSAMGSARIAEGSGLVTGGVGLAGPRRSIPSSSGAPAGFSQWTARGTGGVSWRWGEPRKTESGWVVDYELGTTLGGGAGLTRGGPIESGLSATASADARVERTASGSVAFPDEASARSFRASPDPGLARGPSADIDDALAMRPGSTARGESALAIGGSLSGSAQGVSLGVGGGGSVGSGIEVERLPGERVRVTVHHSRLGQLTGSLGTGPLALQGGTRAAGLDSMSWQLDLSTPGGAAAYEDLLLGRTPDLTADGVQRDTSIESSAATTTFGANLGGLSAAVGTSSADTTRIDAQGRRTDEALGTADVDADFAAASWFDWLPWSSSIGVAATTHVDRDGAELGAEVEGRATVRGGNAKANYETLGKAAGTHTWAGHQGAGTDGTWNVTVDFGDDSLDDLIEVLTDPSFSPTRVGAPADVLDLADALEVAGHDRAAQRAAVKAYGDQGASAIAALRRLLEDARVFVELEGSETWIGEAGWEAVEREVAKLVEVGDGDEGRVDNRTRELIAEHEARLYDLTDHGRYSDVPKAVRTEEIERTEALLERLQGTLPDAADFGGATVEGMVAKAREEMEKRYRWARNQQSFHGVGDTGGTTHRGRLGDTGWFGVFAGPELEAYEQAEALVLSGEEARRMGNAAETMAKEARLRGQEDEAVRLWREANAHYEAAYADFDRSLDVYGGIEQRNEVKR